MKGEIRPYTDWEDWKSGMYREVEREEENSLVREAVSLLRDVHRLFAAMRNVTVNWVHASEANLREPPNNRSWIGQAACAFAAKVPEHLTRIAWGMISDDERSNANDVADRVIDEWKYRTKRTQQMEFAFDERSNSGNDQE
jgi:hypothetical protein